MDMRDSIRPNGQRPSWPPKANQQPGGGPHEGQVRANSFFIFFHLMNLDKSCLLYTSPSPRDS